MTHKIMGCPCCMQNLVPGPVERYQDLSEHVCDPNALPSLKQGYKCVNENCVAHTNKLVWIESGELFSKCITNENWFIDNNDGPFGTITRRLNIEVSKHDEDFILLNLYYWKWKVAFLYSADDLGNILKKDWKIETLKRDGNGFIYYMSNRRMFAYVMDRFKHKIKQATNHPSENNIKRVVKEFEPLIDYDPRFYKKVYKIWINLFYSKYKSGNIFKQSETFPVLEHKKSYMD